MGVIQDEGRDCNWKMKIDNGDHESLPCHRSPWQVHLTCVATVLNVLRACYYLQFISGNCTYDRQEDTTEGN